MLRKFFLALALSGSLLATALAEPPTLKWHALQGSGYSGKLRRTVAEFAGIGPVPVSVYLPSGYSEATRYPVLYVVDGQNLFDGRDGSWELDETMEKLSSAKKIKKIIVVGIHTGLLANQRGFDRMHWFVPKETSRDGKHWEGGGAARFLELLLQLKSKIDHDFSTNPKDTGIMGSSLGGVFAEYAGFKKSEVFQHVGILSPSAWLHSRKQRGSEDWHPAHAPWPQFIWMDMGTHEGDEFKNGAWQKARRIPLAMRRPSKRMRSGLTASPRPKRSISATPPMTPSPATRTISRLGTTSPAGLCG